MKTNLTCLLAAAVLALAGCGGTDRTGDSANAASSPAAAKTSTKTERAKEPARDLTTITYDGKDGATALELLRDNGYDVIVESSKLGDYVTAIGDVRATKTEYWLFEVDGTMPAVGADAYETHDGEQVEWKFGS
ncbi:MAG: hypothetical protein JWL76_388 [Thermoleophilia bacterium]|nr:hypothetical protein [Thermoleophilia bacterium]